MTSTMAKPAFPVWRTVAEAFASAPPNLMALLKIFWVWIAILFGVWPSLLYVLRPHGMSSSEAILATLSTVVLIVLGLSSAAVAWHRLLLLGEPPPLLYLRLGGQVPRYVGRFFVIILIVAAVQLFCAALLWSLGVRVTSPSSDVSPSAEHALLQILVGLIVQVVVILITTRLSISLPGIAVGRPMTLHEAWHATRGHAWRLFGGTLLVWAPSVVFLFLLELSGAGNNILAAVLLLCALFFCTVAAISFISLSYRFFEGAPQPVEP